MAKIERAAGQAPDAIRQFYSIIGSVNFNGHHPHWNGCDYPDALIVFPVVFAEEELANFLSDREEYLGAYGSFRIPVAPDYYHKEGVSGGMWYGVPVPAESADPSLLEEPHSTTFLRYLEIALSWGGFPGLEHANLNHTWPLSDLRNAASEPSVPLNGGSATPSNNSDITEGVAIGELTSDGLREPRVRGRRGVWKGFLGHRFHGCTRILFVCFMCFLVIVPSAAVGPTVVANCERFGRGFLRL